MMKSILRVLLLGILSLGLIPMAGAQSYEDLLQFTDFPADDSTSGSFYACSAKGKWGGYCADCVYVNGVKQCAGVSYSKACQCNDSTCKNSGSCTYEP
jgi:hypothetical protein